LAVSVAAGAVEPEVPVTVDVDGAASPFDLDAWVNTNFSAVAASAVALAALVVVGGAPAVDAALVVAALGSVAFADSCFRHPVTVTLSALAVALCAGGAVVVVCGGAVVCAEIAAAAANPMSAVHVPVQMRFVILPPGRAEPATVKPSMNA
jgi:hypothetical protein